MRGTPPSDSDFRAAPNEAIRRLSRRLGARAIDRLIGLIGSSPRLSGLALRALLDRQLAPDVLCRVPFDDHVLYVDPRDDKIALKLLAGRAWQRRQLETAIATLRVAGRLPAGGLFLDVGANIGCQTVYAMRSGAFASAIAIEPDPHNFDILKRNLAANGLEGRVEAVAAAASARRGRVLLRRHARNHGAHSVEESFATRPAGTTDVDATPLDELLRHREIAPDKVGLVKIDVEGHELAVLQGMAGLCAAGAPLLVELTADRAGEHVAAFKALLAPYYSQASDLGSANGKPAEGSPLEALACWGQSDFLIF